MCYLCSENKGADQLRGYRAADLRLCCCFLHIQVAGFLQTRCKYPGDQPWNLTCRLQISDNWTDMHQTEQADLLLCSNILSRFRRKPVYGIPSRSDTHHLGYVTEAIYTKFLPPFPRRLHILVLIRQAVSKKKIFENYGWRWMRSWLDCNLAAYFT